jgi:hypothetical protein
MSVGIIAPGEDEEQIPYESGSSDESEDDVDPEPWEMLPSLLQGPLPSEEEPDSQPRYDRVLRPKIDLPAFSGHTLTLGQLMQDLVRVGVNGNVSNATQQKYFEVLHKHLPPDHEFPSFNLAVKMVREGSKQVLHEIPACPNDCELVAKPFEKHTIEELRALKCSQCNTNFVNSKGEFKVSYNLLSIVTNCNVCTDHLCSCLSTVVSCSV